MSTIGRSSLAIFIVSMCFFGLRLATATEWVPATGNVYFGTTPLCALVLINGQNQFSCDGTGRYDMQAPLDGNGMVTVQAFADGFAPFREILTPEQASEYEINMYRAVQSPSIQVNTSYSRSAKDGWFFVSGTVNSGGTPVCALVLANGQKMFSCGESLGHFSLEVPVGPNGNITLMVFAAGFQPYKAVIPAHEVLYPHGILAVGGRQACAITTSGVRCWGTSYVGLMDRVDPQSRVPKFLSNPSQVSASIFTVCVLDDSGVWCWRDYYDLEPALVLGLSNPRQISVGEAVACALEDLGLQCWGDGFGLDEVPDNLINPRQVSVGRTHACVLDDTGLRCWGDEEINQYGQTKVPNDLVNPRVVRTGEFNTCVLDDSGVRCWGSQNGINDVPADLINPRQISLGGSHACALDDFGVRCWGPSYLNFDTFSNLVNPREVASGGEFTCTLDDSGVVCGVGSVASNRWGVKNVPPDLTFD